MENIEFDIEKTSAPAYTPAPKPGMVRMLQKIGVRDERMANFILIGVAVIGVLATFYLYAGILGGNEATQETAQIQE